MSAANVTLKSVKGTSSTLVRARFAAGMLLQHEDLEQLNSYTRELSRLLFRSLFGCGVVCGLKVGTEDNCGKVDVTVDAGVALACSGDPIHVPSNQRLTVDEHREPDPDGPLWVVLCSHVKCCAPRTSTCSPDDDDAVSVCTRERDGYEIRVVREKPRCYCGCELPAAATAVALVEETGTESKGKSCPCGDPDDPCYADHYNGVCGCTCADDCTSCSCECILLAYIDKNSDGEWEVDHQVRRFVRPVLMRDPLVAQATSQKLAKAKMQKKAADETERAIVAKAEEIAKRIADLERAGEQAHQERERALEEAKRNELEEKAKRLSDETRVLRQQLADVERKLDAVRTGATPTVKPAKGRRP